MDSWKGHVESKLRKLTKFLEDPNYLKYFEAHLYPFSFKRNYLEGENDEVGKEFRYGESFYYGLKINN